MKDVYPRSHGRHTNRSYTSDPLRQRIHGYFIPLSEQTERLLFMILIFLLIGLFISQIFILSKEEHQELVNKSVRYEGVFHDDQIEIRATLQRR
ncbi:DUF5359 family protein [Caldalkalibacillus thermarum TA2.A1]|uniref:DUF5359 family protein n=1 Tax=Caldalkalibacillus thermarum (strain TA2.A1) TaxID=986075 RepID=A0A8X8I264_CALTT|nr:DUF5359 family protein [Caldalkalibacillus thermarum]QZT32622.1 DUF5359 family protein [Caldalkalibacillus thermarum TA2.A1]